MSIDDHVHLINNHLPEKVSTEKSETNSLPRFLALLTGSPKETVDDFTVVDVDYDVDNLTTTGSPKEAVDDFSVVDVDYDYLTSTVPFDNHKNGSSDDISEFGVPLLAKLLNLRPSGKVNPEPIEDPKDLDITQINGLLNLLKNFSSEGSFKVLICFLCFYLCRF